MTSKFEAIGIRLIKGLSLTPKFLPLLLAPLFRRLRFCFGFFKTKSLAIGEAKSKDREFAIGFFGCSLWKVLINFWRYMTVSKVLINFFFLDSPFTRQDSRGLVFSHYCLFIGRTSCCQ